MGRPRFGGFGALLGNVTYIPPSTKDFNIRGGAQFLDAGQRDLLSSLK